LTLLDANVMVHYLKGHPRITARLNQIAKEDLGIPAIVLYELE
jgi:predicted nucleic acid-binding protein